MEEDQELKHECKFCNKSFPCGRSLGGHMRSHVINSAETDEKKLNKKKLSFANNGGSNGTAEVGTEGGTEAGGGYGLRENPKKTCRFAGSNEETMLHDKFCRECGKGFQSWKALFGHMKCHSERFSSNSVEEDCSWTCANQKPVVDSQSDNETTAAAAAAAPNRKKKRSRRVTRYNNMATTTSSSVSEIEHEQEEVAMCLMMLSRDVGNNKGSGLNSVTDESSDNNFELLEAGSSIPRKVTKTEGKNSWSDCGESLKFKKVRNGLLGSTILDSNSQFDMKQSEHGFPRNESKLNFCFDDKTKRSKVEDGWCGFEAFEVELGKILMKESGLDQAEFTSKKHNLSKKLQCCGLLNRELGVENSEKQSYGAWDTEMDKGYEKKSKFGCTTCNKTFHSYQALGGHRASHKKIKGCFASKIDISTENSIETEITPSPIHDCKLIKYPNKKNPIEQETSTIIWVSKKNKGHECPICFKVFSSGQALGGHKRSHLIGGSEAKTNQTTIVIQKPISEIRDLLDLNLPAPVEEDSGHGLVGFKPTSTRRSLVCSDLTDELSR